MKIFLNTIAAVFVLVAVALALFLVPQHVQIRAITPPIPTVSELVALERADGPIALYYLNTSEQALGRGSLTHSVFVFEWPDGRLLLVDAGMREAQALEFATLLRRMSGGKEATLHGDVAELLGKDTKRVAGVAFTHLHIDHSEGVVALCGALEAQPPSSQPMLLQTSFQKAEQNFNTREGAAILQDSCLQTHTLVAGAVWQSETFPGLGMIPVGGHTPGSTLFAATIGGQLYVLSGDITNTKAAITEDSGKGWVYSNLLVPENTVRTGQLRQWLRGLMEREDTTVVVSHDLEDIRASGLREFVPQESTQAAK